MTQAVAALHRLHRLEGPILQTNEQVVEDGVGDHLRDDVVDVGLLEPAQHSRPCDQQRSPLGLVAVRSAHPRSPVRDLHLSRVARRSYARPDGESAHRPRRLVLADLDGSVTRLTGFPECDGPEYVAPAILPAHMIAAVASCAGSPGEAEGPWWVDEIDSTTGKAEATLVDPTWRLIATVAANPGGGRLALQLGFGPCSTIAEAAGGKVEPLNVVVGEGEDSWNLQDGDDTAGSCAEFGRAWAPTWSLDGSRLAFFGSPQSIGADGPARLDEPGNVYILAKGQRTPETVITDVADGAGLQWSPDGSRLAFAGSPSGSDAAIYILDVATRSMDMLAPGWSSSLGWSPDGTSIAVIRGGQTGGATQVEVIPVPSGQS